MGNRAIIKPAGSNIGVYLHWNGGPDSVEAFLTYCKIKGYRNFGGEGRDSYGLARFVQVVANYFGGGLSVGIDTLPEDTDELRSYSDYLDNGIYEIEGWDIARRIGSLTDGEGYNIQDMLLDIDECQPVNEQLGKDFILAETVEPSDLVIGDVVVRYDGEIGRGVEKFTVVGIGEDRMVNGTNVKGIPYVNHYGNDEHGYERNINNYIRQPIRRLSHSDNLTLTDLLGKDTENGSMIELLGDGQNGSSV